jgi:hypothetical protein
MKETRETKYLLAYITGLMKGAKIEIKYMS